MRGEFAPHARGSSKGFVTVWRWDFMAIHENGSVIYFYPNYGDKRVKVADANADMLQQMGPDVDPRSWGKYRARERASYPEIGRAMVPAY